MNDECHKKYRLKGDMIAGRIVLERYGEIWNLELMDVAHTGKGFGTIFLIYVLNKENFESKNRTVCPISEGSKRFFERHGFIIVTKYKG